jgi:hypothetical protein
LARDHLETPKSPEKAQDSATSVSRWIKLIDLVFAVSVFSILVRTAQVILFPRLVQTSLGYALMSDNIHHYQIGLVLFALGVVFRRRLKRYGWVLFALCLSLLIEEYLVLLYEVGFSVPFNYLSSADNLLLYSSGVFGALLAFGVKRTIKSRQSRFRSTLG